MPLLPNTSSSPDSSSRLYWLCQAGGWGGTALFFALMFASVAPNNVIAIALIYVWAGVSGAALSHAWRRVLKVRGWLHATTKPPWLKLGGAILLLGALQTLLVSLGFALASLPGTFTTWAWLPSAIFSWTLLFAVWTITYGYVSSIRRARQLQAESLRLTILAKEAELRALQAQVNPHFFFNSLNSVRALIFENPEAAAQMIDQLAGVMRYALQANGAKAVTLKAELAAVSAYLAIEKIRFEERLRVVQRIETGLDDVLIPPMVVQTLVENAVKYGIERNTQGGELRIRVVRERDMVRIEVTNTGTIVAVAGSTRVGFENTRRRLALMHGAKASVELTESNGWVNAVISLPHTEVTA